MAKAKALDKRRKSITSIRKITRTMELVATAQFRRAMVRATSADAYVKRIVRLVSNLAESGAQAAHPLLEKRTSRKNAVLFVLTSNRGMCGGYNGGVMRLAVSHYAKELEEQYDNVELFMVGKRGASALRFRGLEADRLYVDIDENPSYAEILPLAEDCIRRYKTGEIDRVDVVYSKFVSLSKQGPVAETLAPFALPSAEEEKNCSADYEFLPSPQDILEEIVPNAFRSKLFKCFLDASVSEQIARMTAMKAATDNAEEMISNLTTAYNRERQMQITNEIIEVVSGASAL